MKQYIIGINSGTSFDGIDVALVGADRDLSKSKFIDGISIYYPTLVKEKIQNIVGNGHDPSLREISQLNFLIGEIFADSALKIIKKNKLKPKDILLIGSHGQTIFHVPEFEKIGRYNIRSTFQIGESAIIAQRTGIKTISNFREGDIAAGGSGAPLMPFLDQVIYSKSKNIKAILNIGGISNVTIVGKNITPIAFDIGPGNALIDFVSKKYFKCDFDKNGEFASKGRIDYKSIEKALDDKYFKIRPPKSTGKELFNDMFIKQYFSVETLHALSLLATLTYFSAACIEKALYDFVFPEHNVTELVISGGGLKNQTLISHLQYLLPDIKITSSDTYNLPYKYKEAMLFALLGYTCHLNIPNNIPSCTGAKKSVVMGKYN